MMFRKQPPPCHFRQFVSAKESWLDVMRLLEFRPNTQHLSLRRQSIEAATQAAIRSCYLLLAKELFELVTKNDNRAQDSVGEEPLVLECLAFSSSFVCNIINPESDDYDLYIDARQSTIESFALMSLLNNEDIENTLLCRHEMYDKASTSADRIEYLSDTFARLLTQLRNGEIFSQAKIRYEDPASPVHRIAANEFISNATPKIKQMIHLIVKREMDEEEDF